jgi:hypothetical protein
MRQPPDQQELIKHRFNPEHFHSKVERILEDVSLEDCKGWYQHPCTQTLVNALEGDVSGIVLMWLDGGYSKEESVDATAQRQAKARGMIQAINDMLQHIQRIRDKVLEGEEYADD